MRAVLAPVLPLNLSIKFQPPKKLNKESLALAVRSNLGKFDSQLNLQGSKTSSSSYKMAETIRFTTAFWSRKPYSGPVFTPANIPVLINQGQILVTTTFFLRIFISILRDSWKPTYACLDAQ